MTSPTNVMKYAEKEHMLPLDSQGIGYVQDTHDRIVVLGFKAKRDIITEIGYMASDAKSQILHACMNVICEELCGKAVVVASLPQQERIAQQLSDDGSLAEEDQPFAAMAELAARYALQDYAGKRK